MAVGRGGGAAGVVVVAAAVEEVVATHVVRTLTDWQSLTAPSVF